MKLIVFMFDAKCVMLISRSSLIFAARSCKTNTFAALALCIV